MCAGTAQVGVLLVSLFCWCPDLQTVQVALFRCMFDMIFVTHKSMMPIYTLTVCTPPQYATTPNLPCVHAVPVFLKPNDDLSTIAPNPVRESGFVLFSFGN